MKSPLLLALILVICNLNSYSQCTPVDCPNSPNLLPFGGICDSIIPTGTVNTPYVESTSFRITNVCFNPNDFDSTQLSVIVRILNVFGFGFSGLPVGLTTQTDQASYSTSGGVAVGCVGVTGTPTQAGLFAATIDLTATLRSWLFGGCNGILPVDVQQPFSFSLDLLILPDASFSGLSASICESDGPLTVTPTGTTGGSFSGPGVSGNSFDPALAGPGMHTITYTVTAQEGAAVGPATNSSSQTIEVLPSTTYYADTDNDTYGDPDNSVETCGPAPTGFVTNSGDCDDGLASVNPDATEVCDGLDNDCDGLTDGEDPAFLQAVCQDITVSLEASGFLLLDPVDLDGGSDDACGTAVFSASPSGFSCLDLGDNSVTLILTAGENTSTCASTVTVTDPLGACCEEDSVTVNANTCDPGEAGTTVVTLTNQEGCDSVVTTITTLLPSDEVTIEATTCNPEEAGTITVTLTNQYGCDSVVTTNTTLLPSYDLTIEEASCDPADTGTVTVTLTASNGCDSVVTTVTTLLPSDEVTVELTSCDPGDVGTTTATLTNQFGCDSVVTTITTLQPSDEVTIEATTCDPEEAGTTTVTLTNQHGCDSVVTTITTLLPSYDITIEDASCDPADTGTVTVTLTASNGCDSLVTTVTALLPSDEVTITETTCEPGEAGTVTETLTNQHGCDSVVTVITVLLPSYAVTIEEESCNPDDVGTTTVTLTASNGCDSVVTTVTTLVPSYNIEIFEASCDPADTGTIVLELTASSGCDSVVTINTELLITDDVTITGTTCDPGQAGTTTVVLTNQFGCDSVVTTITTLLPSDEVTVEATTCDPEEAGTITVTLTNQFGCDSVVTTNTTLLPSYDLTIEEASCDPADTGTVTVTLTASNGCDSVVTTVTTLLPSDEVTITETTCDPGEAGTVTETFTNQYGCDSVVTVITVLLPSYAVTIEEESCNPDDVGTTTVTLMASNGCDSVVTTVTTLVPSYNIEIFEASCDPADTGTIVLELTASSGCDSVVTIITTLDSEPPVAICRDLTIYLPASGIVVVEPEDLDDGSSDNCGITRIEVQSGNTFSCSDLGLPPFESGLLVEDAAGNSSTCTSLITTLDTLPPSAFCQDITVQLDANGQASITPSAIGGQSTDNCGIAELTLSKDQFSCADIPGVGPDIWINELHYDNAGADVDEFIEIAGPAGTDLAVHSIVLYDGSNGEVYNTVALSGVIDDEGDGFGALAFLIAGIQNGSPDGIALTGPGGEVIQFLSYEGSFTAIDGPASGLSSSDIGVAENSTVAAGNSLGREGGPTSHFVEWIPNSFGSLNPGQSIPTAGSGLAVVLTAADNSGNTAMCEANVEVIDIFAPQANCQDVTVALDILGSGSTTALEVNDGSFDLCGGPLILGLDRELFNCDDLGENTVTLTVVDASGNSSTCTATVTVVDLIPPTVACTEDTVYLDNTGMATLDISDMIIISGDNCGVESLELSRSEFDCGDLPGTFIDVIATDPSGNFSTCNTLIRVLDTIPPVAVCQDLTVDINSLPRATIDIFISPPYIEPELADGGSTDNCGAVLFSCQPFNTTTNCIYVYCSEVNTTFGATIRVYDASGNESTCISNITVTDTIPPEVSCEDITVYLDESGSVTVDEDTEGWPDTDDLCTVTEVLSRSTFDCDDIGDNEVVFVATDAAGNQDSCTLIITVLDTIDPVALCRDVIVFLDSTGTGTLSPSEVDDGSSDNCGIADYALDRTVFTCDDGGSGVVELTVTDASGNSASCIANVLIIDEVTPTVLCRPATLQLNANGTAQLDPANVDDGSFDACGIASMSVSQTAFFCSNLGPNQVILTVTDVNGNTGSCAMTVTVEDPLNACSAPDCTTPENLYATDITFFQATLGWDAVPGAIRYQAEGRIKNSLFGLTVTRNVVNNQFRTNPLFPFLTYEYRVRAECAETGWTGWSGWYEFTLNPFLYLRGEPLVLSGREADPFDPFQGKEFVLFPNPTNGRVSLEYRGERLSNAILTVTDITGRIHRQVVLDLEDGMIHEADLSGLENGLYVVSIIENGIPVGTEMIMLSK